MSYGYAATPSVVIVDDDIDHAVIIRTVLSMISPNTAVTVHTDMRAIAPRLLSAPQGAVVLMDRVLGVEESYTLLAHLHERRPDLCIALLSAALTDRDRDRAFDAGAEVVAEKPGTIDGWRTLLSALVTREEPGTGVGGAVA